ncbi:hypothetical protein Tco_0915032 [Tanacetum coccineum]
MQKPNCSPHLTCGKKEWSKQVQELLVFPLQVVVSTSLVSSQLLVDVVQAMDYDAEAAVLDELGALLPSPDAPAGGGGGGGGEGGDPEGVLGTSCLFVSFYELPPDKLDVDRNNITLMTFAGLHISHCDWFEPCRSRLKLSVVEEKNFLYINSGQIPEASSKWSLHCPIYYVSDYLINCLSHLVGNIEILQVIYGIVVVVMIIEVVADDVGSGESDFIVVKLITGVVIGGTEEVP